MCDVPDKADLVAFFCKLKGRCKEMVRTIIYNNFYIVSNNESMSRSTQCDKYLQPNVHKRTISITIRDNERCVVCVCSLDQPWTHRASTTDAAL